MTHFGFSIFVKALFAVAKESGERTIVFIDQMETTITSR